MPFAEVIGFMAAICTTIAFLPQAIQTIRTRETAGLSFLMLSLQSGGCFLWMLYGIWVRSPSLITANFLTTTIVLIVLVIKYQMDHLKAVQDSSSNEQSP